MYLPSSESSLSPKLTPSFRSPQCHRLPELRTPSRTRATLAPIGVEVPTKWSPPRGGSSSSRPCSPSRLVLIQRQQRPHPMFGDEDSTPTSSSLLLSQHDLVLILIFVPQMSRPHIRSADHLPADRASSTFNIRHSDHDVIEIRLDWSTFHLTHQSRRRSCK